MLASFRFRIVFFYLFIYLFPIVVFAHFDCIRKKSEQIKTQHNSNKQKKRNLLHSPFFGEFFLTISQNCLKYARTWENIFDNLSAIFADHYGILSRGSTPYISIFHAIQLLTLNIKSIGIAIQLGEPNVSKIVYILFGFFFVGLGLSCFSAHWFLNCS